MDDNQGSGSVAEKVRNAIDLTIEILVLTIRVLITYVKFFVKLVTGHKRKSVKGDLVLITGAGHGLGREIALQLATLGAKLAIIDINKEGNEETGEQCRNLGAKCVAYHCDITNEENVRQIITEFIPRDFDGQTVDILVNNAGIVQCLPFDQLSSKGIERTFKVNALSHFWTVRACWPAMVEKRRGHIVAVSSIAGLMGTSYLVDYCASKFAVVGMMETLEQECKQRSIKGIKFTTICPLTIRTGMFKAPRTRFEWMFPVCDAKYVASEIVDAFLTERRMITVPRHVEYLHKLFQPAPTRVRQLVQDFSGYGIGPHVGQEESGDENMNSKNKVL